MREIFVPLPGSDHSHRIVVAAGLRHRLAEHLAQVLPDRRLWMVSDTVVARLYGRELAEHLNHQGLQTTLLTVAPGERSKTWPVIDRLTRKLLAQGADRASALVALGGGVVGDLTGFVAAIYMRGIPVVQIPTTLLAMVDAAIGGKTAINLPVGKNLLGAFHQPQLVLIDPEFLISLSSRERRNGLAEVVKAGFIGNLALLELLAGPGRQLFRDRNLPNRELLAKIIGRAANLKAEVVAGDEREGDRRRILNFGHTLGHALETVSRFKVKHGEGVAIGIAAALDFSVSLTGLEPDEAQAGRELLASLGLPVRPPRLPREDILRALWVDKKKQGERLVFVLLRRLGEAVVHPDVPEDLVAFWLDKNTA